MSDRWVVMKGGQREFVRLSDKRTFLQDAIVTPLDSCKRGLADAIPGDTFEVEAGGSKAIWMCLAPPDQH